MFKYHLIFLGIFFVTVFSNSLYTDAIQNVQPLESSVPTQKTYDFSSATVVSEAEDLLLLDQFTSVVFELSQNTAILNGVSNESIIYSDINRLDRIANELIRLLGPNKLNLNFQSSNQLSQLQSKFQESIYKLYVISPYMPFLLSEDLKKTRYYIDYLSKIKSQLNANIKQYLAIQSNLNNGNSNLPFNPQTPTQLSFALESQLNSSILNMLGGTEAQSGMPFSSIASPANADLMNQGNGFQSYPSSVTPNGAPLQMMNYIPSF
ncbi:MAG: hypothetical protein VW397_08560 [Candidatus Margulisiibacteriota bacterium]